MNFVFLNLASEPCYWPQFAFCKNQHTEVRYAALSWLSDPLVPE